MGGGDVLEGQANGSAYFYRLRHYSVEESIPALYFKLKFKEEIFYKGQKKKKSGSSTIAKNKNGTRFR